MSILYSQLGYSTWGGGVHALQVIGSVDFMFYVLVKEIIFKRSAHKCVFAYVGTLIPEAGTSGRGK